MIEKFDPLKGERLQILSPEGRIADKSLAPGLSDEAVLNLYRQMVIIRVADQRALGLQRQGRFGTYAPLIGQEAAQVGSASALGRKDWIFPSFREMGAMYVHGVPIEGVFLYWMGNEAGQRVPPEINVFPISVPVGTQMLHAVGAGWAARIQGEKICTITYFGDGATSEGDFHEAMNFAGVFQAPTIFFCQNNHFAISVPRKRQTASKTLAQKAVAYGFPGIQVDGNDLFACYAATREARERAISGAGPTLIEAVTYRFGPHTTADDPTRYREEAELQEWKKFDPMLRVQAYLREKGLWNEETENKFKAEGEEIVSKAVRDAESVAAPEPEEMFRYIFAEMPGDLKEEMEEYRSFLKEEKKGD
ncbi:MAG TPA: pyruvate dehydrogenase (acetyl-transferring) E1 component subunit alpha [Thermodesulfobacteriota bacterium]|nr:pyruvate dehydrogenase (acetyl-transferring) E1 component subunit alpha [Thermodesulfobacteriota bacterium]